MRGHGPSARVTGAAAHPLARGRGSCSAPGRPPSGSFMPTRRPVRSQRSTGSVSRSPGGRPGCPAATTCARHGRLQPSTAGAPQHDSGRTAVVRAAGRRHVGVVEDGAPRCRPGLGIRAAGRLVAGRREGEFALLLIAPHGVEHGRWRVVHGNRCGSKAARFGLPTRSGAPRGVPRRHRRSPRGSGLGARGSGLGARGSGLGARGSGLGLGLGQSRCPRRPRGPAASLPPWPLRSRSGESSHASPGAAESVARVGGYRPCRCTVRPARLG